MLRALVESARLSNLPTVWTNVLVGAAAAGWASDGFTGSEWSALAVALAAVSLLYISGMFLNDAADARWDRRNNKDRPIVRGDVCRGTIFTAAAVSMILAAMIVAYFRLGTSMDSAVIQSFLVLCGLIIAYTLLHKRTAWSALLMGACRGMSYVCAVTLVIRPQAAGRVVGGAANSFGLLDAVGLVGPVFASIMAYIALLTLAARREDIAGARIGGLWAWLAPVPYLIAASAYRPDRILWTLFAVTVFVTWSLRSSRFARDGKIPNAISGWLAGICLADAMLLMFMDRPDLAGVAVACWLLTVIFQRWIPGT